MRSRILQLSAAMIWLWLFVPGGAAAQQRHQRPADTGPAVAAQSDLGARIEAAKALLDSGDMDAALSAYQGILADPAAQELDPAARAQAEADMRKARGYVLYAQGQQKFEAGRYEETVEKVSASYQDDPRTGRLDYLIQALCKLGRYEEARRYLDLASRNGMPKEDQDRLKALLPGAVPLCLDGSLKPASVVVKKKPAYKQWWPWTILGVAVAGGAAAGLTVWLLNRPAPVPNGWTVYSPAF